MKGVISIGPVSSNESGRKVRIVIKKEGSRTGRTVVELTMENYGRVLSGLSETKCEIMVEVVK